MDLIEALKALVSINTVNDPSRNMRPGEEEARRVASVVEALGLEVELLESGGFYTLYSSRGRGRPVTLFLAHYDTVPPGPGWSRDPFTPSLEDGRLYGRGAADDKSNVAAVAAALGGFVPSRGTVIVAFTGDEEIGGRNGAGMLAEMLEEEGMFPDHVVNGDGSLSRIINRRRAAYSARIRVPSEPGVAQGVPGRKRFEARVLNKGSMHSAYFVPGVDTHPLVAASEYLRVLDASASKLEGGWVKGNIVPSWVSLEYAEEGEGRIDVDYGLTDLVKAVMPLHRAPIPVEAYSDYGVSVMPNMYRIEGDHHVLDLDIRVMSLDGEAVEDSLRTVLLEALSARSYSLEFKGGSGWLHTPPDSRLVKLASSIQLDLGLPPVPVEAGGASDSRYFSPKGCQAIDYGPLGGNIHGPDEYVYVEHLYKAASFYRRIAEKLHE